MRQDATFKIEINYFQNKKAELPGLLIHMTKLKAVKAAALKTLAKTEHDTKSDPSSFTKCWGRAVLEGHLRL